MDNPTPTTAVKINRLLPYWAVFQADVRQTTRSGVAFLAASTPQGQCLRHWFGF